MIMLPAIFYSILARILKIYLFYFPFFPLYLLIISIMQLNLSNVQPKRGHQTDIYEGSFDHTTKLRHGRGVYRYPNKFFIYEGEYNMGIKHGKGCLKLADGRQIKGTFDRGQLIGQVQINYPDGSVYLGTLELGQYSGIGKLVTPYEEYQGSWKDNRKHGKGQLKIKSTAQVYEGQFQNDKFDGIGKFSRWNYQYAGNFKAGRKQGQGHEMNNWQKQEQNEKIPNYGRYQYRGLFKDNLFEGIGKYQSKNNNFCYQGQFSKGAPLISPNQFRLLISQNAKNGEQIVQGEKSLFLHTQPIQYELQTQSFNIYIDSVYQGPQKLDQIQPTQEQIETLVKNWQNQNKKNKNPPPMPDFNQPRMKRPDLVLIDNQSGRPIEITLSKQGTQQYIKIDYREEIVRKKKQNQELRAEALKKAQDEGNKKGGKKDSKGEIELKVNLYKQNASKKQKKILIENIKGQAVISRYQLPDDFPPGKYILSIKSPFNDFGLIKQLKKQFIVKAKQLAKKK